MYLTICRRSIRKNVSREQARFISPDNKKEAVRIYKTWAKKWIKIKPEAAGALEKEIDELLAFLDCPRKHRIKIRTTNVIERSFREVRRRVRTMNCSTQLGQLREDNLLYL